jgi:hypothetical protein
LRWRDHLIPGANPQRLQYDVHGSGRTRHGNRILTANPISELLFKRLGLRAGGNPPRPQDFFNRSNFRVTETGPGKRKEDFSHDILQFIKWTRSVDYKTGVICWMLIKWLNALYRFDV